MDNWPFSIGDRVSFEGDPATIYIVAALAPNHITLKSMAGHLEKYCRAECFRIIGGRCRLNRAQ